jgi:hypothetical protein
MKHIILCLGIFGCLSGVVKARDLRPWEAVDSAIREWYQALTQPDVPTASCCGEADAYWADEVLHPVEPLAVRLTSPGFRRLPFNWSSFDKAIERLPGYCYRRRARGVVWLVRGEIGKRRDAAFG